MGKSVYWLRAQSARKRQRAQRAEKPGRNPEIWPLGKKERTHALTPSQASGTMNFIGRLAQRLERSVYTRKVVRSNRTVPTMLSSVFSDHYAAFAG